MRVGIIFYVEVVYVEARGDLGLVNLVLKNVVLVCKWLWRYLLEPNSFDIGSSILSLVCKWMCGILNLAIVTFVSPWFISDGSTFFGSHLICMGEVTFSFCKDTRVTSSSVFQGSNCLFRISIKLPFFVLLFLLVFHVLRLLSVGISLIWMLMSWWWCWLIWYRFSPRVWT